jgi:hypothetical protein
MEPIQQQEQELNQLKHLLNETLTAEEFFKTPVGELWTRLATAEINRLIKDITSDKYVKDHQGYVAANIELGVWRKMLRKMQVAASPLRQQKINERLKEYES